MPNEFEVCRSCGKGIPAVVRKFIATSLLGLGALCWGCHLEASATGKEISMPEPEPMSKTANFIFTVTNGTLAGPTGPTALPSGDVNGITPGFHGGDIPRLSQMPAYEKEVLQGNDGPVMADSVLQNIVQRNGSEQIKLTKIAHRFYTVGSGDQIREFVVPIP